MAACTVTAIAGFGQCLVHILRMEFLTSTSYSLNIFERVL